MPTLDELASIADASAFIFTGSITGASASTESDRVASVAVLVDDVIKVPEGFRGLVGREVMVQLRQPLAAGRYVFFADPMSIGEVIAVKERTHLDAREREQAQAALERGYVVRMTSRLQAAFLVALGTEGEVRPVIPPTGRQGTVPWGLAEFQIERVLKGNSRLRRVTLVGPTRATMRIPHAPALRTGRHAILILQRPPQDALEHIPDDERRTAAFIAGTSDIQPPDRLETLAQILSGSEME